MVLAYTLLQHTACYFTKDNILECTAHRPAKDFVICV